MDEFYRGDLLLDLVVSAHHQSKKVRVVHILQMVEADVLPVATGCCVDEFLLGAGVDTHDGHFDNPRVRFDIMGTVSA